MLVSRAMQGPAGRRAAALHVAMSAADGLDRGELGRAPPLASRCRSGVGSAGVLVAASKRGPIA